MVGGGRVRTPEPGIQWLSSGARSNRSAGDTPLILILMGQQRPVVHIACRIEPTITDGPNPAALVYV
jgi:hypothetical protein